MRPKSIFAITFLVLPLYCAQSTPVSRASDPSVTTVVAFASPDLEIIRRRVIQDLLKPPVNEKRVSAVLASMRADGSWPDINYVDVSRTGFEHARHLDNMFELSRAYKKPDSRWYQHPQVRDAALSALDYWLEHDFICDNWWWNEMGTPSRMINTLLVLDTDLSERQIRQGLRIAGRANLEASGARPGGDLIQIAGMLGKQALFRRDETVFDRVVSVMADEIRITTGRGLKPDMSFHHRVDNVISTLAYGLGYAHAFAYWAVMIAGTRYSFPEHATRLLIDFFLDGICKSMVHGLYPDPGAKNRDLSRRGQLEAADTDLPESLMKVSGYRHAELEEIIRIRKSLARPALTWNRFFWYSEYGTHQRPDYFASVRMHSSRNHTMEQPHNEEGLKMHHVGDGSNFISRKGREYFDIFPVWDWQKIPGTTVVQKPVHPHWKQIAMKGRTDFVGAACDGLYGAVAMDFKSAHDPLSARKAWFFFDEEYVCLGAGIASEAEYPVFTTLNQCVLNGEVRAGIRKGSRTLHEGKHNIHNASWVWHDSVGYVFTEPQDVTIENMEAHGTWRAINHQTRSSADTVRMDVFTLWVDHGVRPQESKYQYIVVPAVGSAALDRYVRNSPVVILENSPSLQAVWHKELNRAQVVFYNPGKIKVNDRMTIAAAQPCIAMVKTNGENLVELAIADPTHSMERAELRVSALIEGSGDQWKAEWDKKNKESIIEIDLPRDEYAGQSVVLTLPLPQ